MSNRFRFVFVFIVIVQIATVISGCAMSWTRPQSDSIQSQYHEDICDLEKYILSEFGEYILFDEVNVRTGNSRFVDVRIRFLRQYIYDTNKTNALSPIQVANKVREKYNEYIRENPDYHLSQSEVKLLFIVPNKDGPIEYEPFVEFSNWSTEEGNHPYLTAVRTYKGHNGQYSYSFGDWNSLSCFSDIEIAIIDESSIDTILEVADNMPFLKYIVVKDQQTADQATALRPNVKFVSVSD